MKSTVKLPLYLGLSVLVFSVIMSAIKLGNKQAFTSQKTKASVSQAILTLKFTPPDIVSLILTSEKEIKGIDAVLKFNKDQISIPPSSLKGGVDFITTGGSIDEEAGTFSFSAIAKSSVSAGIAASFNVLPQKGIKSAQGSIQFGEGQLSSSSVIDNATGGNILGETQGLKFTLTAK